MYAEIVHQTKISYSNEVPSAKHVQSYHMVGRAASVVSTFYSLLLGYSGLRLYQYKEDDLLFFLLEVYKLSNYKFTNFLIASLKVFLLQVYKFSYYKFTSKQRKAVD